MPTLGRPRSSAFLHCSDAQLEEEFVHLGFLGPQNRCPLSVCDKIGLNFLVLSLMTNCGLPLGSVLLSNPDSARAIHPLSKSIIVAVTMGVVICAPICPSVNPSVNASNACRS